MNIRPYKGVMPRIGAGAYIDPAALVIRHEAEAFVYATVFGQLIDAAPGRLRVDYSRTPWITDSWLRREEW